jgi:hypothetical protein
MIYAIPSPVICMGPIWISRRIKQMSDPDIKVKCAKHFRKHQHDHEEAKDAFEAPAGIFESV